VRRGPALTIGMATYDDFDGVYFTVQALRLYHDLRDTELVVVDNFGCPHTRDLIRDWAGGTYVLATDVVGTAAAPDPNCRATAGQLPVLSPRTGETVSPLGQVVSGEAEPWRTLADQFRAGAGSGRRPPSCSWRSA
jgi:hypothetical protein